MQIPNLFKQVIKEVFYDKNMEIWSSNTIIDEEGAIIGDGKSDKVDSFLGNFQFSTREYIQREYGKEIEANAIVTCDKAKAKIGDILVYDSKDYAIKSVLPSDSHFTLLVEGDE